MWRRSLARYSPFRAPFGRGEILGSGSTMRTGGSDAGRSGASRPRLADVGGELLARDVRGGLHPVLRLRQDGVHVAGHALRVDDDEPGVAVVEDLAQRLEVVAAHR